MFESAVIDTRSIDDPHERLHHTLQPAKETREGPREPVRQLARRPAAHQLAHEQPEVETTSVDQEPFQNVRVPTQMHAAHPAGLIEMSKRPLQAFAAQPQ